MGKKLFVGNLSFDVSESDLRELFGQVGECASAAIITDRDSGRSRGFGFVEMGSNADAQKAISQFNGHGLQGRALNVNEAKDRERGGGGGGRNRGWDRSY